jgi:hypothetical protein
MGQKRQCVFVYCVTLLLTGRPIFTSILSLNSVDKLSYLFLPEYKTESLLALTCFPNGKTDTLCVLHAASISVHVSLITWQKYQYVTN